METSQRWDLLPIKIREAILSEENYSFLEDIGQRYSLPEATLKDVMNDVSNVLYGTIHPEDLRAELSKDGVGEDVANRIYSDVKVKIFDPLQPELSSVYRVAAPQNNPPGSSTAVPAPQATQNLQDSESQMPGAAPFMLHKQEEEGDLKPRVEEVANPGSPVRPVFYTAPKYDSEEVPSEYKPVRARLELGDDGSEKKVATPIPSQTQPEGVRVVNYSELRTKLDDPFAAKIKTVEGGSAPTSSDDSGKDTGLKDIPV